MKRLRDDADPERVYPPCRLFQHLWLDEIIASQLRDWSLLTRTRLRRVCFWFACKLAPLTPPYDGNAYSAEMLAWAQHGLAPPPRLGFAYRAYPWYHTRCPTCGSFREDAQDAEVWCYNGHRWRDPRLAL